VDQRKNAARYQGLAAKARKPRAPPREQNRQPEHAAQQNGVDLHIDGDRDQSRADIETALAPLGHREKAEQRDAEGDHRI
jgi:hypothetical protein